MLINWPIFNQWLIQRAYCGVGGRHIISHLFCIVLYHWVLFLHVFMSFHIVLCFAASNGDISHCINFCCVFFCYLDRFFIHLLNIVFFLFIKSISFGECPPLINPSLLLIIQYDISWSNIEKSELRTLRTIPVNLVVPQKLGYFKSHIAILKVFS